MTTGAALTEPFFTVLHASGRAPHELDSKVFDTQNYLGENCQIRLYVSCRVFKFVYIIYQILVLKI